MGRKKRAVSPAVTAALLIIAGIALAIALYYSVSKLTSASDIVQVQAYKIQNRYVKDPATNAMKQLSVVGLRLVPKADKLLTIKEIVATLVYSDGSTEIGKITYDIQSNSWGMWDGLTKVEGQTPQGPATISPGNTVELVLIFTNNDPGANGYLTSVSFQLTLVDPAGNEYSFSSNEVRLT